MLYQLSYFRNLQYFIRNWFSVKEMRLELTRQNCHYPLKVARLPIPPFLQIGLKSYLRRAQNKTRTCTSLNTRTWNERVYHSATWASVSVRFLPLERKTRLELATLTLARLCSTNWAISAFFAFGTCFPDCGCKGRPFFWTTKTFWVFFGEEYVLNASEIF